MTYEKLTAILTQFQTATGIPFAYYEFKEAPTTDCYIAYYEDEANQFAADNIVYFTDKHFIVELYTPTKKPDTEKILTDLFEASEVYWRTGPQAKIDSENMLQTIFYV